MAELVNLKFRSGTQFVSFNPFPVGSIFLSTRNTSPASIYGGTWIALTDGRFLRLAGSWGGTGGEATHTLTTDEIPPHYHNNNRKTAWGQGDGGPEGFYAYRGFTSIGNAWTDATLLKGGGAAHNNIPPYRDCYAWYRTA